MHQCGVAFNSSPRGQKAVFVKNTPSSKVVPEGWAVTVITAQPSGTTLPMLAYEPKHHGTVSNFCGLFRKHELYCHLAFETFTE